jgi:hypothetical protein
MSAGTSMRSSPTTVALVLLLVVGLLPLASAFGQDLEPRRWTLLPAGTDVFGAGFIVTDGDLFFDPVLLVEDAEVDVDTVGLSYVRSFSLGGKMVRFDALLPWQHARWEGLLDGVPTRVTRKGFADPLLRLSVNLMDAPSTDRGGAEETAVARSGNTVVGAAIAMTVPVGEYKKDKLLNLGQNRFIIRPQIGVVHTRGSWSYELTGSTFFFTDNDEFWNGNRREQEPLYAVQTHVIRTFGRGRWASLSAGYGWGGESTVNDDRKDDDARLFLSALTVGFPISRSQGLRFAYIRGRTNADTGADTDSLAIAWSVRY